MLQDKKSLQAVAFVSSYENVTDEDRLTQEAYATLMNAVFEKMKKTDAPDVNKEKPDVSFVCHDGNGGNIKSYRVFPNKRKKQGLCHLLGRRGHVL